MGEPVEFSEATGVMKKPESMSDELCVDLPVLSIQTDGQIIHFSCWKLSEEEKEEVLKTGKVWLVCYSAAHPPIYVGGIKPFV